MPFHPPPCPERLAKFRELWTAGVMQKLIEHEMGISGDTVRNWRERLNLPPRRNRGRPPVNVVTLKLTDDDYALLKRIARERRTFMASFVAQLIRQAAAVEE